MNKWMSLVLGLAVVALCGARAVRADDEESDRDHVKIEKITAGGAKVTVVEGTDTREGGDYIESTRVTTNTGPVPVRVVTNMVQVPIDSAPHKARLAVLPAIFSEHFNPEIKFNEKIEGSGQANLKMIFTTEHESRMEAPSFTLSLSEAFVGSRKFDVLERARLDETLDEIDFGDSDYADPAKVVPMGQALNAEYVALPEVEVIHLVLEVDDVPYVDTVMPKLKGKMIARVRVVDVASTKVVSAGTEEVQVERKLKDDDPFLDSEIYNLVIDLYKAASLRMLHRTIEAIYPVRLLELADGKAVLNRGEGAISVGDEFDVFSLGKSYLDPDTGEALGQGESKVATIKVSRVLPKFSEAEILEGADVLQGDLKSLLCRETADSIETKRTVSGTKMNW